MAATDVAERFDRGDLQAQRGDAFLIDADKRDEGANRFFGLQLAEGTHRRAPLFSSRAGVSADGAVSSLQRVHHQRNHDVAVVVGNILR